MEINFASLILANQECLKKTCEQLFLNSIICNYRKLEIYQTLTALPWVQLYQRTDAQNMFSFLLKLVSYAPQQHVPTEKKFFCDFRAKNVLKTDLFGSE